VVEITIPFSLILSKKVSLGSGISWRPSVPWLFVCRSRGGVIAMVMVMVMVIEARIEYMCIDIKLLFSKNTQQTDEMKTDEPAEPQQHSRRKTT
jgi:hypothetical protein